MDYQYTNPDNIKSYPAISGEGVMERLLQILTGHPVVQVSHVDFCPIRERLGTAFGTWATGGNQKWGGSAGHTGRCTPLFREAEKQFYNIRF